MKLSWINSSMIFLRRVQERRRTMKMRKEQTQNREKIERSIICGVVFSNIVYIFSTTVLMLYTRIELIDLLEISVEIITKKSCI